MNKEELKAFAHEAAKNIQSEEDLNIFRQMLTKITVERALNAELDDHLVMVSMTCLMVLMAEIVQLVRP